MNWKIDRELIVKGALTMCMATTRPRWLDIAAHHTPVARNDAAQISRPRSCPEAEPVWLMLVSRWRGNLCDLW